MTKVKDIATQVVVMRARVNATWAEDVEINYDNEYVVVNEELNFRSLDEVQEFNKIVGGFLHG